MALEIPSVSLRCSVRRVNVPSPGNVRAVYTFLQGTVSDSDDNTVWPLLHVCDPPSESRMQNSVRVAMLTVDWKPWKAICAFYMVCRTIWHSSEKALALRQTGVIPHRQRNSGRGVQAYAIEPTIPGPVADISMEKISFEVPNQARFFID